MQKTFHFKIPLSQSDFLPKSSLIQIHANNEIEKDFKMALDLQEDCIKIENQICEDQKLALFLSEMTF
jgi:hypothetical protein